MVNMQRESDYGSIPIQLLGMDMNGQNGHLCPSHLFCFYHICRVLTYTHVSTLYLPNNDESITLIIRLYSIVYSRYLRDWVRLKMGDAPNIPQCMPKIKGEKDHQPSTLAVPCSDIPKVASIRRGMDTIPDTKWNSLI